MSTGYPQDEQWPCHRPGRSRRLPGVDTQVAGIDLGATLRALRRRADLSQRELAERAGVPASTVSRVESGTAGDPRFRTVERLVAAAGGAVTAGPAAATPAPPDPHEDLVDNAGRRYPAHLDVRRVVDAKDWWGAWWVNWYNLPRHRWPRAAPDYTFDLDRARRDRRRQRARGQVAVAQLRIERLECQELPPEVWHWFARDGTGAVVGWIGGYLRTRRVDREREFVIGDIAVAPEWRRLGLGRRLVDAVRAELARAGIRRARVLIDEPDLPRDFFRSCGFYLLTPQPLWLTMTAPR